MAPTIKFFSLRAGTHSWVPLGSPYLKFLWERPNGSYDQVLFLQGSHSFLGATRVTILEIPGKTLQWLLRSSCFSLRARIHSWVPLGSPYLQILLKWPNGTYDQVGFLKGSHLFLGATGVTILANPFEVAEWHLRSSFLP